MVASEEARPSLGRVTELFLESLKEGRAEAQQETLKFLRWIGRERLPTELTPADLETYGEQVASRSADSERHLRPLRELLAFARKRGYVDVNLAPHLRARRPSRGRSRATARAQGTETVTILLTADGRQELQDRLESLHQEAILAAGEIKKAAADKDVRENAPLEAAREHHGHILSRIQEIESTLLRAQLIQGPSGEEAPIVRQGSQVALRSVSGGEEFNYILVDPREANSLGGKLSVDSPVGHALLGRYAGEEVEVMAPRGAIRFQILTVE